MVASLSAYTGASGATRIAEAQGLMNEDAQAALTMLTQQLSMAGNNPDQINRVDSSVRNPIYSPHGSTTFIILGCDGNFTNTTETATTSLNELNCAAGATTSPDSIAVNYEADAFNTIPNSSGLPTDCLGNKLTEITSSVSAIDTTTLSLPTVTTVTSSVNYYVADNRYYIDTENSRPSLYCKGNGNASSQALVDNIEDMQFTYGTMNATAGPTATVAGYLTAAQVIASSDLAALPDDAARWTKVITVRICVLVRSERPVVTDAASASYTKCDGEVDTTKTDLRLRRAFSTTVVLKNRRI